MSRICVDGHQIQNVNRDGKPHAIALANLLCPGVTLKFGKDDDVYVDNLEEFITKLARKQKVNAKTYWSRISFAEPQPQLVRKDSKGKREMESVNSDDDNDDDDVYLNNDVDDVDEIYMSSSSSSDLSPDVGPSDEQQQQQRPSRQDIYHYCTLANTLATAIPMFSSYPLYQAHLKTTYKKYMDVIAEVEPVVENDLYGVSERANHLGIDLTGINPFKIGVEALALYREEYPKKNPQKKAMTRGDHTVYRNVYTDEECKKTLDVALRDAVRQSKRNKKIKV